ncbi:hypothetical protein [Bacillus arachidis]|uniref:hypothetical protein n=1 Tax=Bacillus arachidis TaxID=2819290 RepID=UPI00255C91FE|nr:hypothetical protein [Bacillus arachidis]WIY58892.1 hypothetical protein QRY57_00245 [Bacillus arachidis]
MSSSVSDKTLQRLSGGSYKDKSEVKVRIGNHEEVWQRIDMDRELLHKKNGFDATVYQNKETKQIVIAYRGSQEARDFYDKSLLPNDTIKEEEGYYEETSF